MAYTKNEKGDAPKMRRGGRRRKKVCVFCGKENNEIDYKDVNKLKRYVLLTIAHYTIIRLYGQVIKQTVRFYR